MTIKGAKDCFKDNFERYKADPEKFNLYRGLYNLADAIERLGAEIEEMKRKLR